MEPVLYQHRLVLIFGHINQHIACPGERRDIVELHPSGQSWVNVWFCTDDLDSFLYQHRLVLIVVINQHAASTSEE